MNSLLELTATELVTWFARVTGGNIIKGRDARLMRELLDQGIEPVQILDGMYATGDMFRWRNVPEFVREKERWLEEDLLVSKVIVAALVSCQDLPFSYLVYQDLIADTLGSPQLEEELTKAKKDLEQWADDVLTRPANTYFARSGTTGQRGARRRKADSNPASGAGS